MAPPPTSLQALESFPFLTPREFQWICRALRDRVDAVGGPQSIGWEALELVQQQPEDKDVLRIVKRIRVDEIDADVGNDRDLDTHAELMEVGLEDEIDDPEALARQPCSTPLVKVEYNVILSSTYRVPVLYFFLRSIPPQGPQGIEAVYRYLVPSQYRAELGSVGVMGGISIEYHPTLGVPVYFVHPCNTGDALRNVGCERLPTAELYLPLWLGLVGNCVNLHLSSELLAEHS